ncbi:primosomal protein N' [Metabacillus sediminilitoris]|uniref:Replication restart protein PriA n=1 Tax=Metabacillus sediminilitoris TaxID=2567941 RepID=A0A4S4C741_9BACI|nr:primosomal protein N' [Metabacillus sediminilitoris]QGQ46907.1 primosomal protein N' [Metabacillus sediminilitoris]THF83055.1 primosomal protein N' [Metabacillus sediminilitoris]
MKYASVIVDVPAKQTDRAFDYKIPEEWQELLIPGMRVIVPFGPRKVQGFVIETKDQSDWNRLKPIAEIVDLTPCLTPELLELGQWLTEKTLCFKISAFQAMLPAAMKAKYEKGLRLLTDDLKNLTEILQPYFQKNDQVKLTDIEQTVPLRIIQKEIEKSYLEVIYNVKQKTNKKTVKVIKRNQSILQLTELFKQFPANARKQLDIINYFISNQINEIPLHDLLIEANSSYASVKALIKKEIFVEEIKEVYRDPYQDRDFKKTNALLLNNEQQQAIAPILDSIRETFHDVFLLYGVTGSGKTEIYLQSIEEVIRKGKEAIVLVPEISLTPQMVNRFKGRFGAKVAVLHSGLSSGEKYDEWRKIQRKEVQVVVGARSAIFAPFENLGMIIIDEEHESSYKQEENPRYHARDVAIYRAQIHKCPVVLGSATPTLESFARSKKDVYKLLSLKERVNKRSMPRVDIIDMREELRSGNRTMFSNVLIEKLTERLEKGEQSVLLLNKRGYSSFVMCRDCGFVIQCPHCDISLTYHRHGQQLKCHYCGHEEQMPNVCPECQSEHIRFFGTGTQRVEEELVKVLPQSRIIRMDVDTTGMKGSHEKLLTKFGQKEADILLGTQMIAKGLDFPDVTLVGVLTADTMLNLPDFRASEKTFQLLTQVSGRAGRHELPGEVIIQTYAPEHYSIQLASHYDYDLFFEREMQLRKNHAYPPYYYLALLTVSHPEITKVVSVTEKIVQFLRWNVENETKILGPVACPIPRIKDRYRYQCMVKYKREKNLNETLRKIMEHFQPEINSEDLTIAIDLSPNTMM